MSGIAVFDMNETTLDLAPVREVLDDLLGPEGGFTAWFQRLLQLSMTITAVDSYTDFSTLAHHALDGVAGTGSRSLPDDAWDQLAAAMGRLDPYPDVADGLTRLRDAGWSIMALTNSTAASVTVQLERAGLLPLFDHVLSVEAVRRFKPAGAPYHHAIDVAQADVSDMWMVACHDWDLAGARAVGLSTAFVRRPGMSYAATFPPPDVSVAEFRELADRLIG